MNNNIQAQTKKFMSTGFTIPASAYGQDWQVGQCTVVVESAVTTKDKLRFNILITDSFGNRYSIGQEYTYNEVFQILGAVDLSSYFNTGATNSVELLTYLMTTMADIYDLLLNEVSWLKGKLQ